MGDYDLFRKISQSSLTRKEVIVNRAKNDLLKEFESTPSFFMVEINNNLQGVHILIDRSTGVKKILSKPNETFSVGDIVNWNDKNWLISEVDKENPVYQYGSIMKCNNTLNFYLNNTPQTIPMVIESNVRLYNMSVDENKYISELEDTIIARIPYNEITSQININEIFKIGKYNYKLINTSDVLEPGLIILKFQIVLESPEEHNYSIEILNGNNIEIQQNTTLQLNVNVYDNQTLLSPTPLLTYISSDEAICNIDENGLISGIGIGNCVVTVSLASDVNVVENINITIVEEEQNNITYTLDGNSTAYINITETFTANKYNNGILIEDVQFEFSVIQGSTPVNTYTLEIINNTQCSITANQRDNIIILRATDLENGQYVEKEIKSMSLF